MKLCSKKILIDTIKPKKNTLHLLCRLTPNPQNPNSSSSDFVVYAPPPKDSDIEQCRSSFFCVYLILMMQTKADSRKYQANLSRNMQ